MLLINNYRTLVLLLTWSHWMLFSTAEPGDFQCFPGFDSIIINPQDVSYLSNHEADIIRNTQCRFDFERGPGIDGCQLQIELERFILDPPDQNGDCLTASMTILDSATVTNFRLCGSQGNTTLYVAFGDLSRISISFRTAVGNTYRVKVTRIKCFEQKVPKQCLQYYPFEYGVVQSFGWPNYMINQKYIVCTARNAGIDRIVWTPCNSSPSASGQFVLSKYFADEFIQPPVNLGATGSLSCTGTSYVEVIGEDKHCGNNFIGPAIVTSNTGPFMLEVNFKPDVFASLSTNLAFTYNNYIGNNACYGSTQAYSSCTSIMLHPSTYAQCSCMRVPMEPPPLPPPQPFPLPIRKGFCLKYNLGSSSNKKK